MIDELLQGKYRNTKFNNEGQPYAYIPFRHSTEALKKETRMPVPNQGKKRNLYAMALELPKGVVSEPGKGGRQRVTAYGKPLTNIVEEKKSERHVNDIRMRLYRFETTSGKSKGSSEYMTFRTLSAKGKDAGVDWVVPRTEGMPIADLVQKATAEDVKATITGGIMADFKALGALL
jgi:hypothetical protein